MNRILTFFVANGLFISAYGMQSGQEPLAEIYQVVSQQNDMLKKLIETLAQLDKSCDQLNEEVTALQNDAGQANPVHQEKK